MDEADSKASQVDVPDVPEEEQFVQEIKETLMEESVDSYDKEEFKE